jgi:hypothetical protein
LVLMIGSVVLAGRAVIAGPLPQHWIAEGSDWLIHVDAERLAEAEALNPLFDALTASSWGASLVDMGIDARMDVSGITMFGTVTRSPQAPCETTTMLQGGAALREAIQKHVQAHNGHTLVLRKAYQAEKRVSAWSIDALSVHVALVPVEGNPAGDGSPGLVAVLSDNSDTLQSCIGVLLAGSPVADPAAYEDPARASERCPPPGSVLFAWAKDLDDAHPKLRSELLASADGLTAHLGYREEDGQVVVFAGVEVRGNEIANTDTMVSALNGVVEFCGERASTLAATRPEMLEMLPLIRACEISREGSIVKLSMRQAIAGAANPTPAAPDGPREAAANPKDGDL